MQAPAYEKEEEEIMAPEPFDLADAILTSNRHLERESTVMIKLKNEEEFIESLSG